MKIQLSRDEVYTAVQAHLLLKGFVLNGNISQKYTNKDGLLYLEVDAERHNQSTEDALSLLKQNRII